MLIQRKEERYKLLKGLLLGFLQVFWFTGIHRRRKLFQICLNTKVLFNSKGKKKKKKKSSPKIKPMGIFLLAVLCQNFRWVFNLVKR